MAARIKSPTSADDEPDGSHCSMAMMIMQLQQQQQVRNEKLARLRFILLEGLRMIGSNCATLFEFGILEISVLCLIAVTHTRRRAKPRRLMNQAELRSRVMSFGPRIMIIISAVITTTTTNHNDNNVCRVIAIAIGRWRSNWLGRKLGSALEVVAGIECVSDCVSERASWC